MELTTLTLCCDKPMQEQDARYLRGFFGQRYQNRPEFHHHGPSGLIYSHPLIQYKTIGGTGRVMGIESGSFLIRALPPPETLTLNGDIFQVIEHKKTTETILFGPTSQLVTYRFLSPWLALNQDNYQKYSNLKTSSDRKNLLNRILIGNLISLCKSIRLTVENRLQTDVEIEQMHAIEIKPGINLTGFTGTFTANFQLPLLWGIGKQSARGFGAVREIKE